MTAPNPQEPQNLRATRRQSRAARRTVGEEAQEQDAQVEVMPARAADVNTSGKTGMNGRKPTPENPNYTRNGYKAKEGQRLWEATGSSGQIAVRSSADEMVCGIDVADVAAQRELARLGQVWEMFPSTEKAEKKAGKLRAVGFTVKVVPVRPYAGQPNDPA